MALPEIPTAAHRRSREQVMTYSRFAATLLFAGSLVAGSVFAQQRELPFESAGDFLSMPADLHFGEVAGVATTSKGSLLVYFQGGGPNATIAAARQSWRWGRRPGSTPGGCPWRWWPHRPLRQSAGQPACSKSRRRIRTGVRAAGRTPSRRQASRRKAAWLQNVSMSLLAPLSGGGLQ